MKNELSNEPLDKETKVFVIPAKAGIHFKI